MSGILSAITAFTNWVWGIPMLVFLVGGGVFLTVRLGFLQFRKLPFILKNTIGKSFGKKGENGKVPPDKKTSWGKRERYSFGYAVFLILTLMK